MYYLFGGKKMKFKRFICGLLAFVILLSPLSMMGCKKDKSKTTLSTEVQSAINIMKTAAKNYYNYDIEHFPSRTYTRKMAMSEKEIKKYEYKPSDDAQLVEGVFTDTIDTEITMTVATKTYN